MKKNQKNYQLKRLTISDLNSFISFRDWCYENIPSYEENYFRNNTKKIKIDDAQKILSYLRDSIIKGNVKEFREKIKELLRRLEVYEKDGKEIIP